MSRTIYQRSKSTIQPADINDAEADIHYSAESRYQEAVTAYSEFQEVLSKWQESTAATGKSGGAGLEAEQAESVETFQPNDFAS